MVSKVSEHRKCIKCAVNETTAFNDVQTLFVAVAKQIDDRALRAITPRLFTIHSFRMVWRYRSLERIQNILSFDMVSIRLLVGPMLDHYRRSCLSEEEEKSIQHLSFDFPTLRESRLQVLGMYSFQDLECLRDVPLINLLRFVNSMN